MNFDKLDKICGIYKEASIDEFFGHLEKYRERSSSPVKNQGTAFSFFNAGTETFSLPVEGFMEPPHTRE